MAVRPYEWKNLTKKLILVWLVLGVVLVLVDVDIEWIAVDGCDVGGC